MKMRHVMLVPIVLALAVAGPVWAGNIHIDHDGLSLDFEGDTLVVEGGGRHGDTVEISADFELTVNGREVDTDRKDRRLLKAYYEQAEEIEEVAMQLGMEGARIGIKGAAIGIGALGKVLRLLSSDYDTEDLEAEIEAEAEAIELEAEGIEEAAEVLEDWVDDLEDIGDELQDRIPELDDLDWF
jgi:hypothetical protein